MGKVKQTVKKVSKPAAKESKTLQKKISKKKTIKNNDLVPVLKKIGINVLLNDSKPEPTFQEEIDEKSFKSLLARPKNDQFDEDQIQTGVSALFKLVEKTSGQEPKLFEDGENIFLQIVSIKVPKTPTRQIHLNLTHSLLKSDSEICLIVQDREDAKDYDNTIEYYEKVLKKHGIINIKCIMPYHQFNNEYAKQFELKRKLASLYDFFLVDAAVHGYVVARLGKIFYTKRKMPVAFNMKATNLKGHLEKLLHKSVLQVHPKSDCYSVEVGNTKMKPEEVAENVIGISEDLNDNFPGGFANIRSLGVKTNRSIWIPLYLTLRKNNSVRVPVIKARRPKEFKAVSGELTTFADRVVTVLPSGEIFVKDNIKKRRENHADDEELEFEEEELSESEDEEKPAALLKKAKQDKKKAKKAADLKEEEESEDSNLEEAEESYLNFYKQEQVKMAKERKVNKKNVPQNKKVVEESEDDLNLEDSDGSDFGEVEHPNFDESEESDEEILPNFHEKKAGNKPANKKVQQQTNNKKGNQHVKVDKTKGSAQFENRKRKQEDLKIIKGTAVEKAFGEKNEKLAKKQKKAVAPSQIANDALPKQNKKAVLTKQKGKDLPKQDRIKKEEVVKATSKKAKKEIENKSKRPNRFAKIAK